MHNLDKIISGGQSGADRAGLDAALRHGIAIGGYCPKGRKAEDGPIPERYPLAETSSPQYAVRTGMNVRGSDGTLILNLGLLDGGTELTVEYAAKQRKPCLVVQLDNKHHTPAKVADWIADNGIRTLNIAGPRESKRPGTYNRSLAFLESLIVKIANRAGKEVQTRTTELLKQIFPPAVHAKIFLVGGIVRDILTGRDCQDIDLVAALTRNDLQEFGFRPIEGKSTSLIMFRHHPDFGKIEVTLIPTVELLADDLASRDFTCNALAMTLAGGLIDPLKGCKDLKERTLRVCSEDSFKNDPIRIFRAFRFESCGWMMAPGTEQLIRAVQWNTILETIAVERFSREMQKALAGGNPQQFFRKMLQMNAGESYLPEIFRMPLTPAGPLIHHPEGDLFTHSCQVLERVSAMTGDPLARFCAFFHDLGKLSTDPALYPKHHGHDDAGYRMAQPFCDRLKLPTSWKRAVAWVNRLHGIANKWDELRNSTKIRMAEQAIKAGIVEILPLVSAADKPGNPLIPGWDTAVDIVKMTVEELGIGALQLEMMPPAKRGDFILQKRVEELRKRSRTRPEQGWRLKAIPPRLDTQKINM